MKKRTDCIVQVLFTEVTSRFVFVGLYISLSVIKRQNVIVLLYIRVGLHSFFINTTNNQMFIVKNKCILLFFFFFYFHVRVILLIYEWITSKNTVKDFFMSWLRFRLRKVFYDCCSSSDGQRGPSETCKVFCSSCRRCYNWRELRIQCHLFCFAMWFASEREIFLEDHISLNLIIGQPLWKNIPF